MECNTTKKFTDYTDEIMKEFPYLSKHDIEIIVDMAGDKYTS